MMRPVPPSENDESVRVLVVDDQELFRRGLTMLLSVEEGIDVVGEAGDGIEGTELAASAAPDVVLLDVRMPKRTGIEACKAIKEAVPAQVVKEEDPIIPFAFLKKFEDVVNDGPVWLALFAGFF